MELIDLDDQRSALVDIDSRTQQVLADMKMPASESMRQTLGKQVHDLLLTKRKYLDDLIDEYNTCAKNWLEMEEEDRLLISATEKYAAFIDEHVLWVRSTRPLQPAYIQPAWQTIGWLTDPAGWQDLGTALLDSLRTDPLTDLAGFVLLAVLLLGRKRIYRRLDEIERKATKGYSDAFVHTLEAMLLTLLLAVAWPGLMWFIGWRLSAVLTDNELVPALAAGLRAAGTLYLALEFARQVCSRKGLGRMHFHWAEASMHLLRRNLAWLIPAAVPLTLLLAMVDASRWRSTKSRSAGSSLSPAWRCWRSLGAVLRPGGAMMREYLQHRRDGWADRLRYIWYPLAVGMPVALCLTAAAGYYYTAMQLATRLLATGGLIFGAFVVKALLLRLLFVGRRKLVIEEARKRQAANPAHRLTTSSAAADQPAESQAAPPGTPPVAQEPDVDVATVDTQTRRLIRVAILFGLAGGLCMLSGRASCRPLASSTALHSGRRPSTQRRALRASTVARSPRRCRRSFRSRWAALPWQVSSCWLRSLPHAISPACWKSLCCDSCRWRPARDTPSMRSAGIPSSPPGSSSPSAPSASAGRRCNGSSRL